MPMYAYKCDGCDAIHESVRPVVDRNFSFACGCGGMFTRRYTPAFNAAIKGIHNRLNRHWNEGGKPIDVQHADVLDPKE